MSCNIVVGIYDFLFDLNTIFIFPNIKISFHFNLGGAITKIIYDDARATGLKNQLSDDLIQVRPNVAYTIKVEFLRGNFPDNSVDKSASITLDGLVIGGECEPDGSTQAECNFVECSSRLRIKEIASSTGSISVSVRYGKKSDDCHCDRNTWICSPVGNQTPKNALRIHAAARITLFPKTHTSGR